MVRIVGTWNDTPRYIRHGVYGLGILITSYVLWLALSNFPLLAIGIAVIGAVIWYAWPMELIFIACWTGAIVVHIVAVSVVSVLVLVGLLAGAFFILMIFSIGISVIGTIDHGHFFTSEGAHAMRHTIHEGHEIIETEKAFFADAFGAEGWQAVCLLGEVRIKLMQDIHQHPGLDDVSFDKNRLAFIVSPVFPRERVLENLGRTIDWSMRMEMPFRAITLVSLPSNAMRIDDPLMVATSRSHNDLVIHVNREIHNLADVHTIKSTLHRDSCLEPQLEQIWKGNYQYHRYRIVARDFYTDGSAKHLKKNLTASVKSHFK